MDDSAIVQGRTLTFLARKSTSSAVSRLARQTQGIAIPKTSAEGPAPIDGNEDGTATCDIGVYEGMLMLFLPKVSK